MVIYFIEIPGELIVRILSRLHPRDLISCRLSSKHLDTIIRDSLLLQYHLFLWTFSLEDNSRSSLTVSENFQRLMEWEDAWANLTPKSTRRIYPSREAASSCTLPGGILFLRNFGYSSFSYLLLPKTEPEISVLEWKLLNISNQIVGVSVIISAFELDLFALIVSIPDTPADPDIDDYYVRLLQFSTGNPHPQAANDAIHVMTNCVGQLTESALTISGEYLVVVLNFKDSGSYVMIYEWRTSFLKMKISAPYGTYRSGVAFITKSVFLLPNWKLNRLEIWELPLGLNESSSALQATCALALPKLVRRHYMAVFRWLSEYDMAGNISTQPFYNSWEERILILNSRVARSTRRGPVMNDFFMIIRRPELLGIYNRWRKATGVDNQGTFMEGGVVELPWSSWGNQNTRWFFYGSHYDSAVGTMSSHGQRILFINYMRNGPYVLLDFNPRNLSRRSEMSQAERKWCEVQEEDVTKALKLVYMDEVANKLPFTITMSKESYEWLDISLDDMAIYGHELDRNDISGYHIVVHRFDDMDGQPI